MSRSGWQPPAPRSLMLARISFWSAKRCKKNTTFVKRNRPSKPQHWTWGMGLGIRCMMHWCGVSLLFLYNHRDLSLSISICPHLYLSIDLYLSLSIYMSTYMTANMYTYMPIYMYIDIPTYANTRTCTDAEKKARRRENKASAALRL